MLKRIKSAVLPSSTKGLVVGLMVAALLVVTAGFVAAQSSTDSKVINGCYDTKTGALRILNSGSSCTPKEEPISWNQAGPQGPAGTSNAYATGVNFTFLGENTTVAHLNDLPDGKYVVSVSMFITNFGPSRAQVLCGDGLRIPFNVENVQTQLDGPTDPPGDAVDSMSWTFPLELGSTETVNLECRARHSLTGEVVQTVRAENILMTALRVDEITRNTS